MKRFVLVTFLLALYTTSTFASIILENRNYSDISIKYLNKSHQWVNDFVPARSFIEIKRSVTTLKIDTDDMFVEYEVRANSVYTFFIDQDEMYWDIRKITDKDELLPYIKRGMISKYGN